MPLITTIQELAQYAPVAEGFNMTSFASHIRRADRDYLYPVVGRAFYDYIRMAKVGSSLSPMETAACELMMEAESILGIYKWITKGQVNVSSAGIRIANTEGWKTAFQWQIRDLQSECLHDGLAALEELIEFLNLNLSAFPLYAGSDEYLRNYSGFLNSGKEFNEYFTLNYPRYTFLATNAIRRRTERQAIVPVLGQPLADLVIGEIRAQNISPTTERLMPDICGAVANLTVSRATVELSVNISDKGITVYADSGTSGNTDAREPASDTRLEAIRRESEIAANGYLANLRKTLQEHAADYPLYVPVTTAPTVPRKDDDIIFSALT